MDLCDGRLRGLEAEVEELREGREQALHRAALLERLLGRERSRTRTLWEALNELRTELEEERMEGQFDFDGLSLVD
jgi:hypothetical protein